MMSNENTDVTELGTDVSQEAFVERWKNQTDEDRDKLAISMFSESRGLNRKITELHDQINELRGEKEAETENAEKAVSSLSGLQNEIAEIRAQKLLVAKQAALLQKAADHDIDAALAIRFAETADADGTFELAIAEIERRAMAEVNKRLGNSPQPKGSPGESMSMPDLSRMSRKEIERMPASLRDQAFEHYVGSVTDGS